MMITMILLEMVALSAKLILYINVKRIKIYKVFVINAKIIVMIANMTLIQ